MIVKRKRNVPYKIIALVAILTVPVLFLGYKIFGTKPVNSSNTSVTSQRKEQPKIISASSRLLVVGDVFWGRQYERKRLNNEPNAIQFPFSGLASYDKSKYNTWIADIECPITDRNIDFQTQWDAIALNCRPEFMGEFAKWFEIATLANNHIYDIDKDVGYNSTTNYLDKSNIQYFGHFLASEHDKACKVVNVGLDVKYSDNSTKKTKLPIAMCGYHGVISIPKPEDIAVINKYSSKFFTIAMPHMGVEYQPTADSIKTSTYHAMVDAGADVVAGGHPHWVQNTESYKNKLIVYSMGNFIFDQQSTADVQRSVALDASLDFNTPEQLQQLDKWLNIEEKCQYNTTCLNTSLASYDHRNVIPSVNYDLVVGQQKNLVQAKSTDSTVINQVLARANWANTKAQLKN